MVFSSLFFLYAYLPLCLIVYHLVKKIEHKNTVLLVFSLFFYAWGEPFWVLQLLISGSLVYLFGRLMAACRPDREQKSRKLFLILGILSALIPLLVFKYSDFFIANINAVLGISLAQPNFALPIGISFYTFQIISYIVDLYWGNCQVQKRLDYFLLYQSFFPQLIAGPIVRYTDIEQAMTNRHPSAKDRALGARRFVAGLAKKCLIANYAGSLVAQTIESSRLSRLSGLEALIGLIAYSLQIYYDFSAYSDMAIGLGRIFGFHFPENFNYPYIARSVTDFWRRWHISLSSFFRDYVYIPLGGNRRHQLVNLCIVWFLTGFWHGASWNFIFWGLYYLVFLILEKTFLLSTLDRAPRILGHLYMVPITLFGWALFYFTDLSQLGIFLSRLFALNGPFMNLEGRVLLRQNFLFLVLAYLGSLPLLPKLKDLVNRKYSELEIHASPYYFAANLVQILGLLLLSTASLAGASYNPFLYFRF
ncbi:MAG: MBOAT family O-acyltransferase [Eubacteriales bacterium]|nr:MBOAT family protein [Clostridiales bacterium]MDY5836019.1 MBOAT family O-acyltransferase [Eubacteriales bacterium]